MNEARAIVAGHGEFASGIVSAVDVITGRGSALVPIAVPRLGAADIESLLRERMAEHAVRVIFTDLQAGSCSMAARRILHGTQGAALVCGVNLPLLLDFVFAEDKDPVEAARRAAERGRASILVHEGTA